MKLLHHLQNVLNSDCNALRKENDRLKKRIAKLEAKEAEDANLIEQAWLEHIRDVGRISELEEQVRVYSLTIDQEANMRAEAEEQLQQYRLNQNKQ